MWSRIEHEQWQVILTMAVFCLTFSGFIFIAVRTIFFLKKETCNRLANMPLKNNDNLEENDE